MQSIECQDHLSNMQIITNLTALPETLRGGAISIGKFDGMHLGHSLIVQRLKSHAQHRQIPAILVTFDPPPVVVLRPDDHWKPLCTLERKIELIRNFHVDAVVVIPTTRELLQQSAEAFFYETVQNHFQAKVIVAGKDFSFGRDRVGTPDIIRLYGRWTGIEVDIVDPLQLGTERVSSSGIRQLLQAGQIERVNELMPFPYRMTGTVIPGEQRGRTLGFPTANLGNVRTILPKQGVYATATWIAGKQYGSTTHIGTNPTFNVSVPKIEVFATAILKTLPEYSRLQKLVNEMPPWEGCPICTRLWHSACPATRLPVSLSKTSLFGIITPVSLYCVVYVLKYRYRKRSSRCSSPNKTYRTVAAGGARRQRIRT